MLNNVFCGKYEAGSEFLKPSVRVKEVLILKLVTCIYFNFKIMRLKKYYDEINVL